MKSRDFNNDLMKLFMRHGTNSDLFGHMLIMDFHSASIDTFQSPLLTTDVAELKDMMKTMLLDKQKSQAPATVKAVEQVAGNMRGSGSLPSNTVANPKGDVKGITTRSGASYDVRPQSSPPTFFLLPKEVENGKRVVTKDYGISFSKLSARDAFLHYALIFPPMFRKILNNKDKIIELTKTLVNENYSAVILKKFPEKLGDPGRFLIPCNFLKMDECLALADLGASINLMPLSIWKVLNLGELNEAKNVLRLADSDSISTPTGHIAQGCFCERRPFLRTACALIDVHGEQMTFRHDDQSVTFKVGDTRTFSYNIVESVNRVDVMDMGYEEYFQEVLGFFDVIAIDAFLALEDDPTSPKVDHSYYDPEGDILLLEAFINDDPSLPLPTQGNYLPEIQKELKVCEAKNDKFLIDEPPEVELKDLPPHLEYAFLEDDDKLPVIVAKDLSVEEKAALISELSLGNSPTLREVEKLFDAGLIYPISDSPWVSPVHYVPKKGGFTVVENDESELIPTRLVTGLRVCIDYRKLNEATRKDHFPLPFMDQMPERLAGNEYYCFLDGFSGYFQIPIDPHDQEKTTFTCPYGMFAYLRMPFGLCNAPGMFQRCMMAIFHDMIEKMMEVFMDDFSVFGNSFGTCLSHLDKMLKRCEDTNLCLNWEKSHFMVKEGIVLGHKISKNGIEVDKAKVDVIAKLPHPTTVKGVGSFRGHASFYRRFIKDFSKISRPMTYLLEKNTLFIFSNECIEAFQTLKKKLTEAPILIAPDWDLPQ
ncbi:reverse transcriptase domain-containing protein [Tanacetum coccineum]